jgi:LysM repeat protein
MADETPPDNPGQPDLAEEEQTMKHKEKPASKIPTTQTNTNRKKTSEGRNGPWGISPSLFKKNDAALIIGGALVVTLVVFFVFFRSSGSRSDGVTSNPDISRFQDMETRLSTLEQSLAHMNTRLDNLPRPDVETGLSKVRRQVDTLESGIRVQVDALKRQMARLEDKMTAVQSRPQASQTPRTVTVNPEIQEKNAVEKSETPSQTAETTQLLHTVQKGETLWRISQKYDTTVDQLRKLNNLAPNADIYAGAKIRVR